MADAAYTLVFRSGSFAKPDELLFVGDLTEIAGKHLNAIARLLKGSTDPTVKGLSQCKNIVCNARVPRSVDPGEVSSSWHCLLHKCPSLLSRMHHCESLSQRIDNKLRKVRAKRSELNRSSLIDQARSFGNLIVLPRANRAVRVTRYTQSSADMDLLDEQIIRQNLCEHFGLLLSPSRRKNYRRCTYPQGNQRRHERGGSCENSAQSRYCAPYPCGFQGRSDNQFNKHCRIPLRIYWHSAMAPLPSDKGCEDLAHG